MARLRVCSFDVPVCNDLVCEDRQSGNGVLQEKLLSHIGAAVQQTYIHGDQHERHEFLDRNSRLERQLDRYCAVHIFCPVCRIVLSC